VRGAAQLERACRGPPGGLGVYWWVCTGGCVLVGVYWWVCTGGCVLVGVYWWVGWGAGCWVLVVFHTWAKAAAQSIQHGAWRLHGPEALLGCCCWAHGMAKLWRLLLGGTAPFGMRGPPGAAVHTLASSSIAQNSPPETVPLAAGSRRVLVAEQLQMLAACGAAAAALGGDSGCFQDHVLMAVVLPNAVATAAYQ
jgi:hypothetical protein